METPRQDLEAYMQIELYPTSKYKLKSELLVPASTAMLENKVSQTTMLGIYILYI